MLSIKAKKRLISLADYLEANKNNIIVDGDTHPTNLERLEGEVLKKYKSSLNYYHGRPISCSELILEMDAASVDMAITWQNPSTIVYSTNKDLNYKKLLQANQDIFTNCEQYPNRFIPCGWTDPKALGLKNALKLVDKCVLDFGFPVVKMNPAQNGYPIDSEEVVIILNRIIELGATPALHYGGDTRFTPASGLKYLAEIFAHSRIIAVHMGGGGSHFVDGEKLYLDTRALGLQHPNLFFVLSAKRDCHIESDLIEYTIAGEPFMRNMACGSDAPYGKVAWNFGGFNSMFKAMARGANHTDIRLKNNPKLFSKKVVQGFLGRNLAELIVNTTSKILETNPAKASNEVNKIVVSKF